MTADINHTLGWNVSIEKLSVLLQLISKTIRSQLTVRFFFFFFWYVCVKLDELISVAHLEETGGKISTELMFQ